MFRYLPEQASSHAANVDWIHNVITDLSVFFTVAIVGAMIYFAIAYRKRDGVDHDTPAIEGSHSLEALWTIVPTIICIFVAYYGIIYYHEIRAVPVNAMTINVTGQKWWWDFEYENGKKTTGELVVPVDQPVKLILQSKDVLHSFFIPSMRVKSDAVPGQYTFVSFTPIKTGYYKAYCTEYCGDSHYNMLSDLRVVSRAEYDAWLNDKSDEILAARMNPVELGGQNYVKKGCNSCHSLDGSRRVGPSFLKLFGREAEFDTGEKYVADEAYLRTSILNPKSQIVKGYGALMPAYAGQLNESEITHLIAFIKAQDGSGKAAPVTEAAPAEVSAEELASLSPAERGEKIYQNKLCITCHSLDGSRIVGPSFRGLYNHKGEFEDGTEYIADEEYLKEAILYPNKHVVKGYPPAMPQQQFSDDEISDLIAYIKSLEK